MGNSASNQEGEYFDAQLPADLFDLKDSHFQRLWKSYPLTPEQVTQAARSIPKTNSHSPSGLYVQEEESKEALLAVRLSNLLPELAALRFRLVPGRLKEDRFWQATLILLKERLVDYNATQYDNDDEEDIELFLGYTCDEKKNIADPVTASESSSEQGHSRDLARELTVKDAQIAKLQKQIKELQKALADSSSNCQSTSKTQKHKGFWETTMDSKEFLEYPDEVKDSLRKEKQRRLQLVRDEMKFILDSDNIEDSNGKWDCCGKMEYRAACSR